MDMMVLQSPVGPCDPPAAIERWIDELLDLRMDYAGQTQIIAEIDFRLFQASEWLGARVAGLQCA